MLLEMETFEQESLSALRQSMEMWRRRLHTALDRAGGNQLDPAVQLVSREFDHVMNLYMQKMREATED